MADKNAARRRTEGKAAERFTGLNPAGGEPRQGLDDRRNERVRRGGRQRSSPEVKYIDSCAERHGGDQQEQHQTLHPLGYGEHGIRGTVRPAGDPSTSGLPQGRYRWWGYAIVFRGSRLAGAANGAFLSCSLMRPKYSSRPETAATAALHFAAKNTSRAAALREAMAATAAASILKRIPTTTRFSVTDTIANSKPTVAAMAKAPTAPATPAQTWF